MPEKIAIFFDAENISSTYVEQILNATRKYGDIVIQRTYADWSNKSMKSWQGLLETQPLTPIHQFHNGEKQCIDKSIIMDAIQIASERSDISTFCIVASDKGYTPLVLRLRELGKKVLGFGEKEKIKEDSRLVKACNEYRYLEDLPPIISEPIKKIERDGNLSSECEDNSADNDILQFSLLEFLKQAYNSTPRQENGFVLMNRFAQSIREQKSDFNYKEYGYSGMKAMIEDFPQDFEITSDGKQFPSFFVNMKENEVIPEKEFEGTIKRFIHHYGIIEIKDEEGKGDYYFHLGNILKGQDDKKIRKGQKVKFTATKMPSPTAENSREKNGKAEKITILD